MADNRDKLDKLWDEYDEAVRGHVAYLARASVRNKIEHEAYHRLRQRESDLNERLHAAHP